MCSSLEKWLWKKDTTDELDCQEDFFFFFSRKHLVWVRMCTQVVGADTDLSLGWRPAARAALAARPWETGGRHPNVITAAKLLSIKAKLQKYVPWGLQTMKTEPRLSGCCLRSAVEVVLRCVWGDLLWARNSRFHSCWQTSGRTCGFPCGNYCRVNLAIMPCYCSSSLILNECALHRLYDGALCGHLY